MVSPTRHEWWCAGGACRPRPRGVNRAFAFIPAPCRLVGRVSCVAGRVASRRVRGGGGRHDACTSHRPGWPAVPEPRAPRLPTAPSPPRVTAAAAGDTVVVCAGTYKETVAVAKALTLSGQGATIDATGLDNGVKITASNVTVSGFTVENATGEGILAQQPTPVKGPMVGGHAAVHGRADHPGHDHAQRCHEQRSGRSAGQCRDDDVPRVPGIRQHPRRLRRGYPPLERGELECHVQHRDRQRGRHPAHRRVRANPRQPHRRQRRHATTSTTAASRCRRTTWAATPRPASSCRPSVACTTTPCATTS